MSQESLEKGEQSTKESPTFKEQISKIVSYKPFALRTGILYNYIWILIYFVGWCTSIFLLLLHGYLFDINYYNTYFYPHIDTVIVYTTVYIVFNWIYRTTVKQTNNIILNEQKFQNLFINDIAYEKFKNKFYKTVYNWKELLFMIPFLLLMVYNLPREYFDTSEITIIYQIGFVLNKVLWYSVVLALGSVAYYVVALFYRFFRFVGYKDLIIFNYLKWFRGLVKSPEVGEKIKLKTTLYSFQHDTRIIGAFLFSFFFKFIILLIVADLSIFIPALIFPNVTTEASVYWLPGTLICMILFVVSQWKIHAILSKSKEDVLDGLMEIYNLYKQKIYEIFYEEKYAEKKGLMDQITFIKSEIEEISKMGTWTYDFPAILKMIGAALITVIPLVFEFLKL